MVIGKSYVGDWFLIYLMGQNIDSVIFKDVIHELAKKLGYRSRDIGETWLSGKFYLNLIYLFNIFLLFAMVMQELRKNCHRFVQF